MNKDVESCKFPCTAHVRPHKTGKTRSVKFWGNMDFGKQDHHHVYSTTRQETYPPWYTEMIF
eukprot:5354914-Karenia_brevis.AAC.1